MGLASLLLVRGSGDGWTRGSYAQLTVSPAGDLSLTYAGIMIGAPAPNGTTAISPSPSASHPTLGDYDEIVLLAGKKGNYSVRWFSSLDAFVFDRRPAPGPGPDADYKTAAAAADPASPPPPPLDLLSPTFPLFTELGIIYVLKCVCLS